LKSDVFKEEGKVKEALNLSRRKSGILWFYSTIHFLMTVINLSLSFQISSNKKNDEIFLLALLIK
jgi:hypothetical protein